MEKMDLCKRLSSVSGLNQYIELTQDLESKYKNVNVVLNMSTILSVKKHRCLEIEYFNKCDGTGAAFKLFERMLSLPASKTWGLLGSEVVSLLQYWLEAVRKHLISQHIHWWTFLKHLLGFIKIIRRKDSSISNVIVEGIAEAMLDLASNGKMDVNQRYETLHTFNLVCADSSREVRMALKNQLEPYFIRLATTMGTCAHLPSQLAALETLLRWLQPRRSPLARRAAADKWLLPHLYAQATIDIFLERNWMNFFQDARDFLNCHNETKDLVTSVICRKFSIGNVVLLTGEERRETWLDLNSANNCVSMILDPQLLEVLGHHVDNTCEALVLRRESVGVARFYSENKEIKVAISTVEPPAILPSDPKLFDQQEYEVTFVISSKSNLARVNNALRVVFEDRYQNMVDVEAPVYLSPVRAAAVRRNNSIDDQSRFSHPVKEKPRKPHSGYVAWRRLTSLKSPSTASTASLAQLHDKLANLPYYEFTKEPVSVCAQPELSVVNEVNESEISNSLGSSSTFVLRRCAVKSFRASVEDTKSQSDNELARNKNTTTSTKTDEQNFQKGHKESQSDNECVKKSSRRTERVVSSLFAATIGSAEDSIINETLERLPKDKELNTDNLIELLVQEALQAKTKEDKIVDSGINTGDGKTIQECDSETIEDTQYVGLRNRSAKTPLQSKNEEPKTLNNCTIVSKSTSDESNTEAINDTPVNYVNVRKRNLRNTSVKSSTEDKTAEKVNENAFDEQAVEDFFSQHFAENKMGDVIISPTLAKKINESSSESGDDYLMMDIDDNFDIQNQNIPDLDVVECLNDAVDKVTPDMVENNNAEIEELLVENIDKVTETNLEQDPELFTDELKEKEKPKKTRGKGKQTIKSKIGLKKQKPAPKKGKLKLEPVSKMSTIIEVNNESDSKTSNSDKKTSTDEKKTPLARRRRKLYSPKVDQITVVDNNDDTDEKVILNEQKNDNKHTDLVQTDDDDDIVLNDLKKEKLTTPKSAACCYKELEKERQRYRTRAKRSKRTATPPSPRTKKANDMFERLKSKVENDEKITLIDKKSDKDVAIFNYTSDSEDEEFKQKKIEVQKRTSTTTIGSGTSVLSTRRGKKKKKCTGDCKESSSDANTKPKRKRVTKRKNTKANAVAVAKEPLKDLIDERMREANNSDVLNTSFIIEQPVENTNEPAPIIQAPEIEVIEEENANLDIDDNKQKVAIVVVKPIKSDKKPIKPDKKTTKRKMEKVHLGVQEEYNDKDENRTTSPLPGLIIENEKRKVDVEDSLNTNFIQKIIKEGVNANDTTNTQNMLSDNEKPNFSPRTNITEELGILKEENAVKVIGIVEEEKVEINNSNFEENIFDAVTVHSGHSSKISTTNSVKSKRHKLQLNKTKKKEDKLTYQEKTKATNKTKKAVSPTKDINQTEPGTISNKSKQKDTTDSQKSKKSIRSNIEQINFDEIVSLYSEVVTRSKAKLKSKSPSEIPCERIVVVDITSDTNQSVINCEKSIPTGSIDGHGDKEEMPPSPKHLKEKLLPREMDDMDDYIKECFIELNKQVNISKSSSERQPTANLADEKHSKKIETRLCGKAEQNLRDSLEKTEKVNGLQHSMDQDYDQGSELVNDNTQASYDTLQNLMEKLDTTLVEIHQNTTKDFISLFVEAQKQLVELKEERREMYRETAVTVMTEVTKLLDHHFSELDRRAAERDGEFMRWLRERAGAVLRRDCHQKKAMVQLLREDVQAAVEHLRHEDEDQ